MADNPTIESPLFDLFLDKYERKIDGEYDGSFTVPDVLKGICKVYFIHNKRKPISYHNVPDFTIFIDDVDKCLNSLNPKIKKETREYFEKVDETTERNMRDSTFESALVGFFHLEGYWQGILRNQDIFYNKDGPPKTEVESILFHDVRVVIKNGILTSNVMYGNRYLDVLDHVCFKMPGIRGYKDGIYENCMLFVPKVDVKYQRKEKRGDDMTVINFRYTHDNFGFKATDCSNDSCGGGGTIRHKFVLDRPFKITVYYKYEKMLKVRVDNI